MSSSSSAPMCSMRHRAPRDRASLAVGEASEKRRSSPIPHPSSTTRQHSASPSPRRYRGVEEFDLSYVPAFTDVSGPYSSSHSTLLFYRKGEGATSSKRQRVTTIYNSKYVRPCQMAVFTRFLLQPVLNNNGSS